MPSSRDASTDGMKTVVASCRPHRSRKATPGAAWPWWLQLSLLLLALLLFVVPSFGAAGKPFKSQNLLPVLATALLALRMQHLRFPRWSVTTSLLGALPLLLLLQGASGLLLAAGAGDPPPGLQVTTATVLKQLRDPLAAWLVLVILVGHHRLLQRIDFTQRAVQLMVFAGAVALLLYYRLASDWAGANYVNPRGFLAGFEGPNSLGAAVALIVPFGVAAVVRSRSVGGWLLNFAGLGVLGVLLLLSGSRGAVLALFAAGGIALVVALALGYQATAKQWLIAPVVALAVAALVVAAPSGPVARLLSTDVTNLATDLSTSRRIVQLETAVALFGMRPVTGWGIGGYEAGYTYLNPGVLPSTTPHNAILLVAVQGGAAAVLALLVYYALLALSGLQAYLRRRDAFGVAALAFPLCVVFLDLFFPYTLTHDVGAVAAVFAVSLHLHGRDGDGTT